MSACRTKGTTLIELIVTTAVVAVIMSAVFMIWQSNTAAARGCSTNARLSTEANSVLNQLARGIENLVETTDYIPIKTEIHSGKVIIKLHTHFSIINDTDHQFGPFIAEYVLDTQTGQLKYRQTASTDFDDELTDKNKNWESEKTRLNNIELEYYDGKNWINNLVPAKENNTVNIESVRITISQKDNQTNNTFSLTVAN